MSLKIVEQDDAGTLSTYVSVDDWHGLKKVSGGPHRHFGRAHVLQFLSGFFLPAGYPTSVTPDYLHYQIYNALQSFCSSFAGLIASRGILEGFGVGNADASATHALLLTVLQDVSSRLTTILGAYYLGTSLFPEAKTHRFLADLLNDAGIIADALTPLFLARPQLRVCVFCVSGALKALCGVAAGGAKTALTVHFARAGDVGELNAKDASKETVLGLSGMLLGTLLVPHLTTTWSTYTVLAVLLAAHLLTNYIAVRGVVLYTLNRQRAGIAWTIHRGGGTVLTPADVARRERILTAPDILRDAHTGRMLGRCTLGASFAATCAVHSYSRERAAALLEACAGERYVLCVDGDGDKDASADRSMHVHVCFRRGYTVRDQLKAWIHAHEVARVWTRLGTEMGTHTKPEMEMPKRELIDVVKATRASVDRLFEAFVELMEAAGWVVSESVLMAGAPRAVLVEEGDGGEKKKI